MCQSVVCGTALRFLEEGDCGGFEGEMWRSVSFGYVCGREWRKTELNGLGHEVAVVE